MPYLEIKQKEFEEVLSRNGYKWEIVKDSYAKETVYLINFSGNFVKIFSSIESGVSRPVGSDAMRIVAWDPVSNLPVIGSEGRINRTDGWKGNLVARIEGVRAKMVGTEKCKICGGIMVERINGKTKEKFLGCLNWKGHQKNDANIKKECKKRIDIAEILEKITRKSIDTSTEVGGCISSQSIGAYILESDIWNNLSEGWKSSVVSRINTIRFSVNNSGSRDIAVHRPIEGNDSGITPCTGTNEIINSFHDKMVRLSERLNIRFQEVIGNEPLLETKIFQWGNFPMERFNPIQSKLLEFVSGDNNVVVEAKTSTGKTVMGEMFMWKVLQEGRKIIYTSPLKALTREKWDSWSKRFGDKGFKIAIVTGDYRLTDKRIKELNEANIILCTSEMLDHRTRNMASEKSEWLAKAGLLIVDEVQMVGMKDRGDKLEAGLMRFTSINPKCRLILLSGTMPNSGEISGWIRDLNGKDTILVKSAWRPIKLNMKYEGYNDSGSYYEAKSSMLETVINEVKKHGDDKILVFVHSKADGRKIMTMLEELGYSVEFHNADLDADERINIEESFKRKVGGVRIIIATSTLAYGLNLPARVVIIAGMHRGIEEVSELDIVQMCGRSGRMGIDTEGDAIMVFPRKKLDEYRKLIESPRDIMSQINNPFIAAFHVIGEITTKAIKTREDVYKWYSRTLAVRQGEKIDKEYVDQLIDYLLQNNAIKDMNGILSETEIGKAAVYFYLRPDMLKDLIVNWTEIFKVGVESNDFIVSLAMSRLRIYLDVVVSKADRAAIEQYHKASMAMDGILGGIEEGQAKIGMAYLNILKGLGGSKIGNPLAGVQRGLSQDIERLMQAMIYLDTKHVHWQKEKYWGDMALRLKYSVGPELIPLCRLGISGIYARRLYDAGIRQPTDLITNKRNSMMILGMKYHGIIAKNEEMFKILGYDIRKEYT
jgi:replicative superfamily II helicase